MLPIKHNIRAVRGSTNGNVYKSTSGTIYNIFTNSNQKTLNVVRLPMVPLVDHIAEIVSYCSIHLTRFGF